MRSSNYYMIIIQTATDRRQDTPHGYPPLVPLPIPSRGIRTLQFCTRISCSHLEAQLALMTPFYRTWSASISVGGKALIEPDTMQQRGAGLLLNRTKYVLCPAAITQLLSMEILCSSLEADPIRDPWPTWWNSNSVHAANASVIFLQWITTNFTTNICSTRNSRLVCYFGWRNKTWTSSGTYCCGTWEFNVHIWRQRTRW